MITVFDNQMYYCVHCVLHPDYAQPFQSATYAMHHVEDKHKVPVADQKSLQDYISGFTANQQWKRRCEEAVAEGTKAAMIFDQPDYTVDDFLVDIGEPAKEDAA